MSKTSVRTYSRKKMCVEISAVPDTNGSIYENSDTENCAGVIAMTDGLLSRRYTPSLNSMEQSSANSGMECSDTYSESGSSKNNFGDLSYALFSEPDAEIGEHPSYVYEAFASPNNNNCSYQRTRKNLKKSLVESTPHLNTPSGDNLSSPSMGSMSYSETLITVNNDLCHSDNIKSALTSSKNVKQNGGEFHDLKHKSSVTYFKKTSVMDLVKKFSIAKPSGRNQFLRNSNNRKACTISSSIAKDNDYSRTLNSLQHNPSDFKIIRRQNSDARSSDERDDLLFTQTDIANGTDSDDYQLPATTNSTASKLKEDSLVTPAAQSISNNASPSSNVNQYSRFDNSLLVNRDGTSIPDDRIDESNVGSVPPTALMVGVDDDDSSSESDIDSDLENEIERRVEAQHTHALQASHFLNHMCGIAQSVSVVRHGQSWTSQMKRWLSEFLKHRDLSVKDFCNNADVSNIFPDILDVYRDFDSPFATTVQYEFPENFQNDQLLSVVKDYVYTIITHMLSSKTIHSIQISNTAILMFASHYLHLRECAIIFRLFNKRKMYKLEEVISKLSIVGMLVIFDEFRKKLLKR